METYNAINIRNVFYVDKKKEPDASFWLLYQTDKKSKYWIRFFSKEESIVIQGVLPESVCYILYKEGKYYKKESLAGQIESLANERLRKEFNVEQLILKEDFGINVPEEVSKKYYARYLRKEEIYEIIVNEFNGFCVLHPDTYMSKCVEVCYRPNTKKLYKAFLDTIYCQIDLEEVEFDFKQYFLQALEDEQKFLLEEECWKLFDFLEESTKMYYISGNTQAFNIAKGELEIKDVYFVKKGRGIEQAVYYDDKKVNLKEKLESIYTTREDKTTLGKKTQGIIKEMVMQGEISLEKIHEMEMQVETRLEKIEKLTIQTKENLKKIEKLANQAKIKLEEIQEMTNQAEISLREIEKIAVLSKIKLRDEMRREIVQAIIQEMKVQGGEIEEIKEQIIAMIRKEWQMGWGANNMVQAIIEQKIRQLLYKWWIEGVLNSTIYKGQMVGVIELRES